DAKDKPYEGSFLCLPSKIKGPLTVYQNNKIWFAYADGTPFYLFVYDLEEADVLAEMGVLEQTLDFVKSFGFNAIVAPHCGFSGVPGIGYRAPWVNTGNGFDFSRYDLRFWRNMDKVIFALKKRNMFLFPANIFGGTNGVPRMPENEWENFIKYWTARWSGFYNVTFQPMTEWEEGYSPEEILRILGMIKRYDPWNRLVSVHSWNYSKKAPEIPRSSLYDYFTLQNKLVDWNYWKYKDVMKEILAVVEKPILAQECIWEGDGYQRDAGLDVDNMRKASWTIVLSGAHLSYADQVTPPRQIGKDGIFFGNWGFLMEPAGKLYPYLKFIYQIISSAPWWNMRPYFELEGNHSVSLVSLDKSFLIVYLPEGNEVIIKGLSGRFEVKALDPVKCKEERKFSISTTKDGYLSLSSPKEQVFILKK
ncbi:DUF4038 domain-containing protein, partial [bacterium]|nr:DUF4038 domain-containing protein [bacterium]